MHIPATPSDLWTLFKNLHILQNSTGILYAQITKHWENFKSGLFFIIMGFANFYQTKFTCLPCTTKDSQHKLPGVLAIDEKPIQSQTITNKVETQKKGQY